MSMYFIVFHLSVLDVVQHVLANGSASHRFRIVAAVHGSLVLMSTHKFASNVVEKCFLFGSGIDRMVVTLFIHFFQYNMNCMYKQKFHDNLFHKVLVAELMNTPHAIVPGQLKQDFLALASEVPLLFTLYYRDQMLSFDIIFTFVLLKANLDTSTEPIVHSIPQNLAIMASDSFGNYVVQTLLSVLEKSDRDFLLSLLELSPYGIYIIFRC